MRLPIPRASIRTDCSGDKNTYEIMRPESVGLEQVKLVMGKLSGRHAFRQRLESWAIS